MSTRPELEYQMAQDSANQRDAMILAELPQVNFIAARIRERLPQHLVFEDLVHAGVLGLVEATGTFDASKAVLFKTYAKFRIRGAILDSLRDLDWGPRSLRKKSREIEAATAKLEMGLGRQPTGQEIADELKISLENVHELLAQLDGLMLVSQRVSAPYDRAETQDLIESAPSRDEDPFEQCLRGENNEHLAKAVASLSPREQRVLSLYYREELTMREISEILDIAESRVSQLHSLALVKLRAHLANAFPGRAPAIQRKPDTMRVSQ